MSDTNIFKDKTPQAAPIGPSYPPVAVQVSYTSAESRDARLPGERRNWEAGVQNIQRPRYGRLAD